MCNIAWGNKANKFRLQSSPKPLQEVAVPREALVNYPHIVFPGVFP